MPAEFPNGGMRNIRMMQYGGAFLVNYNQVVVVLAIVAVAYEN